MRTINTETGSVIKIYSNAKEMPVERYNTLQKYLVLDSGIGSDMASVTNHFSRLDGFLQKGDIANAKQERENLHYNIYSILQQHDYTTLSFACFVSEIGNTPCNDISEDGLSATRTLLQSTGITREELELHLQDVKKK